MRNTCRPETVKNRQGVASIRHTVRFNDRPAPAVRASGPHRVAGNIGQLPSRFTGVIVQGQRHDDIRALRIEREGTAVRIIRWVFIDTAIRFGHGSDKRMITVTRGQDA